MSCLRPCEPIFDREQGVGTCTACGKNFECGAFVSNPRPRSDVQERFMPKQEVYHSSTLGPIPLSFTGRHLMQNLREAFQELLQKREEQAKRGQIGGQYDWEQVSRARGEIAKYISQLERRSSQSMSWRDPEPLSVLARRYSEGFGPDAPPQYKKKYQVRDVRPDGVSRFVCVIEAHSMDEALTSAMKFTATLSGYELRKRSEYEVRVLED